MLICRDFVVRMEILSNSLHYFIWPWEWCHDDAETWAISFNICLLMLYFNYYFFIKKVLKQLIGLLQMDLQLQDRREFR